MLSPSKGESVTAESLTTRQETVPSRETMHRHGGGQDVREVQRTS